MGRRTKPPEFRFPGGWISRQRLAPTTHLLTTLAPVTADWPVPCQRRTELQSVTDGYGIKTDSCPHHVNNQTELPQRGTQTLGPGQPAGLEHTSRGKPHHPRIATSTGRGKDSPRNTASPDCSLVDFTWFDHWDEMYGSGRAAAPCESDSMTSQRPRCISPILHARVHWIRN